MKNRRLLAGIGVGIVVVLFAGSMVSFSYVKKIRAQLVETMASQEEMKKETDRLLAEKSDLEQRLKAIETSYKNLSGQYYEVSDRADDLERLLKTDAELLQKYSKVFFLNENYIPATLLPIDPRYLYNPDQPQQFHERILTYLVDLLGNAKRDGITLQVVSAYRSFGTQAALKNGYVVKYGSGANTFSADQGYSEHQLGSTIDLTTPGTAPTTLAFEKTAAFAWMQKHAHEYGFVLSYSKGNNYYVYEPWHWRFVGRELANYLHNQGKNFYDLEQRQIDDYLDTIFD